MSSIAERVVSRQATAALSLLAQTIRARRIKRGITQQEMAVRTGISRSLLQRIEKADPGCAIGTVFEVAVIAGVSLFSEDPAAIRNQRISLEEILTLLPKAVRKTQPVLEDDF